MEENKVGKLKEELNRYETGASRSKKADDTPWSCIPPECLDRLVRCYGRGAKIHGLHNWKRGMPKDVIIDHMMEHINKYRMGNRTEDHLAAIAWASFALMYFDIHGWYDFNDTDLNT